MPKSLVRKFMKEGLTEKQAEGKAIRIERARKTMTKHIKPLPPKRTSKKKKKGSQHKSGHKR